MYLKGEAKEIDILDDCTKDEFRQFACFMGPQAFTEYFNDHYNEDICDNVCRRCGKSKGILGQTSSIKFSGSENQVWFIAHVFHLSEHHLDADSRTYHYYFRVDNPETHFLSGYAFELAAVFNNPHNTFFSVRAYAE